jgi:hypothetical protein
MAKVEIVRSLFEEIKANFKAGAHEILDLLECQIRRDNKRQ